MKAAWKLILDWHYEQSMGRVYIYLDVVEPDGAEESVLCLGYWPSIETALTWSLRYISDRGFIAVVAPKHAGRGRKWSELLAVELDDVKLPP